MNYECKSDPTQLNQPISVNESIGENSSNVEYIDPASDRRNNQQVDGLLTIFESFELNMFRAISIPSTRIATEKVVTLVLKLKEFKAMGMLMDTASINKMTCK